ncbi:hypothetical protein [Sandaracinus amylolyticus]|uniref:Leucine-rich repeat domain-containing protein n=1 Tax=Sandaracinus amylolyticus TaxID=927083 RepID=A0A0F6W7M0_9BACT|nr:hypothetical protein [Sandaracinus amylolyticus]AKF09562.1 hypothetical protein DB32_006711 [Sandaracinus amylolyticus]
MLRVKHAAALHGVDAVRSVPRLELEGIGDLDLAALGDARRDTLTIARSRIRGDAPPRATALRLVGFDGPVTADAETLEIMPASEECSLGPIGGTATELRVYNSNAVHTIELGGMPELRSLGLSCLPGLRALHGASACPRLKSASLYLVGLIEIPALPDTLEELSVDSDLEQASALAGLVRLRNLKVTASSPVRGLADAIVAMRELEHLALGRVPFAEVLPVLSRLPALRSLALCGYSLERVPDLDVLAPAIEVLSLEDCRGGFLEHDALARMPALRELRLAGSTLETFKSQLDPALRKRGVEVRFDRAL